MKISEMLSQKVDSYATMKIFKKAMEEMSLSEEEIKTSGFVQVPMPDGKVGMSWITDPMKEVEFGETVLLFIKETLKRLSDSKTLRNDQIDLYEKFIENSGIAG
jgi:hypothetical protein